jgi:hypothetical protein
MASLKGIFNTDVNYPGINIKVELTVINEYLERMALGVKAICDEYIKDERKKNLGLEYFEYQYIYRIAEDEIPKMIRMPFLLTINTLFENSLIQLLNFAQKKEGIKEGVKDINGKSLPSRFNKYLSDYLKYDFYIDNNEMEKIITMNKIRNIIAHTNGNLDSLSCKKSKEINLILLKNKQLTADFNQLNVSYEYLQSSMILVFSLTTRLMCFMEKKYNYS